ncbi:hypothetical protein [Nocardia arthritidis]|uniref:Uncharacterized protein n=1 Tax=Nocardia arthritidis TaxID=228602 RepID=A0A6G9YGE5_9NOCA|nr:hypothetical protein [Nocardia arthritidis]QIS12291.1 hypothetical protein F5544_22145 [Nocardia arthritidis]
MKKIVLLFSVALAAGIFLAPSPVASAAVDQACTVNEVATFSPPLTDNPQTVTITTEGNLFDCTSGSAPTGTYAETLVVPGLSCTNLLVSGSGTRVLTWVGAAAPSTFTYNRTATLVNGNVQVVFLGEIASGTFTPDPAKEELTGPALDPTACATTGVARHDNNGTLTIGI